MPITQTPYPILSYFACAVIKVTGAPPQPLDAMAADTTTSEKQEENAVPVPKAIPKGVVLGKDGKP